MEFHLGKGINRLNKQSNKKCLGWVHVYMVYDDCDWYSIKLKIILQNKHVSDQLTVNS